MLFRCLLRLFVPGSGPLCSTSHGLYPVFCAAAGMTAAVWVVAPLNLYPVSGFLSVVQQLAAVHLQVMVEACGFGGCGCLLLDQHAAFDPSCMMT